MGVKNNVGNNLTGQTGSGKFVGDDSATLITPDIGVAEGTSLNLGSSTTIVGFIDDDTFATATNDTGATSESIKAYVDSVGAGGAASQAQMEAATSTTVYTSPGRQQYHPSSTKFFCFASYSTGTPVDLASYNQSSITDTSAGIMTHNLTVSFSSASYCALASVFSNVEIATPRWAQSLAVGSYQTETRNDAGAASDLPRTTCAFGDQ